MNHTQQQPTIQEQQIAPLFNPMNERLINKAEVLERVGMSHTTMHQLIRQGKFPDAVAIPAVTQDSMRKAKWRLSDVVNWIQTLPFKTAQK
tara:strand:- start:3245 stop:3517 length:273 start_codon:yes stop_codon:yes gene_type:complete